jgi:hypothetical protein
MRRSRRKALTCIKARQAGSVDPYQSGQIVAVP